MTGHAQPGCYLSFTRNCSPDISGEHYVSKGLLKAFGPVVGVTGMPWLPKGTTRQIGINSLTANILCKRHNSALAPLDTTAGQFFQTLRQVSIGLDHKSLSRKVPMKLFCGEEIERWMLKALCGMFHARLAMHSRSILADTHTLDHDKVEAALQWGYWYKGCGLYMNGRVGTGFRTKNDFGFTTLTNKTDLRLCGCIAQFVGFEFVLIVDPTGGNVDDLNAMIYRPSQLIIEHSQRRAVIFLSWPLGTTPQNVTLRLTNKPVPRSTVFGDGQA